MGIRSPKILLSAGTRTKRINMILQSECWQAEIQESQGSSAVWRQVVILSQSTVQEEDSSSIHGRDVHLIYSDLSLMDSIISHGQSNC